MRKFYDLVGFVDTVETEPGIYEEIASEYYYYGDILRNTRKFEAGGTVNGKVKVNNSISIVADAFAFENFFKMRYIYWMGTKWTITNIEVDRPRLILTIGDEYHGVPEGSAESS